MPEREEEEKKFSWEPGQSLPRQQQEQKPRSQGSRAESSTPEALGMIVRELRVTNLILLELSRSLNFGVPITDELEGLRDDMSSLNLN